MKGYKQQATIIAFIVWAGALSVACANAGKPHIEAPTPIAGFPQQQPISAVTLVPISEAEANHNAAQVEPVVSTTFVEWVDDETVVEGATSSLTRMEHGVYMTFDAVALEPGEAYTVWWVIFNKPNNCSDGECGLDDSFVMDENGEFVLTEEGARTFNLPARDVTTYSELRATGSIVDADGTAEFRAHLPVGDVTEAEFGPGLLDPMKAEIHVILRSHGPIQAGIIHQQMNTPWGGCAEDWPRVPCKETQFAVHIPPEQ